MELKTWLDTERGRATSLAAHLGITVSMVSQMASRSVPVPPGHYRSIRDFTKGEVGIEDLLPPVDRVTPTQQTQEG